MTWQFKYPLQSYAMKLSYALYQYVKVLQRDSLMLRCVMPAQVLVH